MGCANSQDTASLHRLQAQAHRPGSEVFTPDPENVISGDILLFLLKIK